MRARGKLNATRRVEQSHRGQRKVAILLSMTFAARALISGGRTCFVAKPLRGKPLAMPFTKTEEGGNR